MPYDDLPDVAAAAFARDYDMALDPRRLRPAELVRLLNSTPLGESIDERRLREHRSRAGFRIGDDKTVDLFRYIGWLWFERQARRRPPATGYEAKKEQSRRRSLEQVATGQDIGELPPVKDPERRARCERNLRLACETYFPLTFPLKWSPDHLKVIAKIQLSVLEGGLFALAMPRGSGKTSLAIAAAIWALLYGHREFVALIAATEGLAAALLDGIRVELEHNDLLCDDFPEVCYVIRQLEGINQRRLRYRGEVIAMGFTSKRILLPCMPGSKASGGIVRVAGITGSIRGMNFKRPDGRTVRPSLVIVDDPQTRKSAKSPAQNAERERILAGDILGLAGPGQKMCGVMPCTVILPGDMADNILDRKKHPDWNGERTKMLNSFPTNEKLWEEYYALRCESLENGNGGREATEFYAANRAAMDEGADVAWPERHDPDELSGLQHAMNKKMLDEAAFFAEFQNEPIQETTGDDLLTVEQIMRKVSALKRGIVPRDGHFVVAFIDVQQNALYWTVAAWSNHFSGQVIDYGTYPDQKRAHFAYRDARHTLGRAHPGKGMEGALVAGLTALTNALLSRDWQRDDGSTVRIGLCLVDANWETDTVKDFCRDSPHAAVIRPARGRGFPANKNALNDSKNKKRGDLAGLNWRIPAGRGRRSVREVVFDSSFWKSFLHSRLSSSPGDRGCLTLFHEKPEAHRLFAEHLTSERRQRITNENTGRTADQWDLKPGNPDNHWFDGAAGCCVAGSVLGAELVAKAAPKKKPRKTLGDMRRERMRLNARR